ncbi:PREDICTED: probable potassium transporter 13 isoform X4 [Populus euphratica]|uniref:Potassium transporter n=1 Tax=Populus euphratica TaxID=75702 RepID=A0AAJ6U421_POPEU|nr:PREDICTED: probable potassium transporter 13 isoform X4 [Populus euphratica]
MKFSGSLNVTGGTFALYSLLCRRAKLGLLRPSHSTDYDISSQDSCLLIKETRASSLLKEFFDKHHSSRVVLLLFVILGTSMVIADGILTPSMSVLSAVYGIKTKAGGLHDSYAALITCLILVGLFALQHIGTHRVGFLFAPIILLWLISISGVGIYNIIQWNPRVVSALSPYYVYKLFKLTGKDGWTSLGGIVLCITGAEAMFADLGHFSQLSIRIAFTAIIYPSLILAYMGEAAYLSKHKEDLQRSFYRAIPEVVFWPVFIIATLATVVASQAVISATFSIISQCWALKCFPRVKIINTSNQMHGQIYIPEVNWTLMVFCLLVVIGFRDTDMIANAYVYLFVPGLTVIIVMFVTTCLMFLVIVMVWKRNILAAFIFVTVFGFVELLYLSSCLAKVAKGGWIPLVFSLIVLSVMYIWHYGTLQKQSFESHNRTSLDMFLSLGPNVGINRVRGVGLIYTNVLSGIPPMFSHFVTNFPAFHQVLIFVTFQFLTTPRVSANQRFIVSRIGPAEFRLYRCIVRFGYKDARKDSYAFETDLIETVRVFLQHESDDGDARDSVSEMPVNQHESDSVSEMPVNQHESDCLRDDVSMRVENGSGAGLARCRRVRFCGVDNSKELEYLEDAREAGLAYMMGNTCVLARETSSFVKKFAINIVYGFLRRNCRSPSTALGVPHTSLIEVGMAYRV